MNHRGARHVLKARQQMSSPLSKSRPIMLVGAIAIALLLGAAPAMAFDTTKLGQKGTLLSSDTVPLSGKSLRLQEEVKQALADSKRKVVMCIGMRFPGQWIHLGGKRVAPYTCNFGVKRLQIQATVRISGRNGRVFKTTTPNAMRNATTVSETNLRWKWMTGYSPQDQ
jgi:hypothetical protein